MVSVRNTWWHQFIKENNYRLCVNNSFSGATICHTGYRSEDYSDRSFITRMKALGCPDIIFIFGATNDYWAKSPLESISMRIGLKRFVFFPPCHGLYAGYND